MAKNIKKQINHVVPRGYLSKDTRAFKAELLEYARTYFADRIRDFSEPSVGGMLLDFAAFVGDSQSFYLDHQFNELNVETAVETINVESLVRSAGVKIRGSAPSVVEVDVYVEVNAALVDGEYQPRMSYCPNIKEGTLFTSNTGVNFELTEDLNFGLQSRGKFVAEYVVGQTDSNSNPTTFILKRAGTCVSGNLFNKNFSIGSNFIPFRTIRITEENVTEIISVADSEGNQYYEVDSLTQDVVYKRVANLSEDSNLVPENIELMPAPYRFISSMSRKTGVTTIKFGSGRASTLDDDIVPDPSELALPLYGKKTFSRFSIDPNSLLETQTLGMSPVGTTITVKYRAGGGLTHNVDAGTIRSITTLFIDFSTNVPAATASTIRASLSVNNPAVAEGGENPLTLNELRSTALAFRNSQSRIVTKDDLVARIYTMPTNFGRVFRVGVSSNPHNPLATRLHVLSRNKRGELVTSPDHLKKNLRVYINEFRLISDAIDILDARIINLSIRYAIVTDSTSNASIVVQNVNSSLKEYLQIENFQIGEPLMISDLENLIINTDGVTSLSAIKLLNVFGVVDERQYGFSPFSINANTEKNILVVPEGSIFEVRYPDYDIIGSAT
jgi:hypothetical protein